MIIDGPTHTHLTHTHTNTQTHTLLHTHTYTHTQMRGMQRRFHACMRGSDSCPPQLKAGFNHNNLIENASENHLQNSSAEGNVLKALRVTLLQLKTSVMAVLASDSLN